MAIAFASQDEDDDNVAILTLDERLEKNTEYSLLTVFGADGSIDFKTGDSLEGIEILNPETDDELRRHNNAQERVKSRKELAKKLST